MRTLIRIRIMIPCFLGAGLLATRSGLPQTVINAAGNGSPGFSGDNGPATSAQIDTVYGVTADGRGNTYLADTRNHRVRKIANGIITTVAGTGQEGFSGDGGAATAAQFSFPRDVAVDVQGNLYIADTGNCRIRKVTPAGTVSTLAGTGTPGFSGDGGSAASAQLSYPEGLAIDSTGNLYVADSWNYRVRKITTDGKIQTVVGNGSYGPFGDGGLATSASLGLIQSLTVDVVGNLYLSDSYNHCVRKVAPGGAISTVIGGGFGPAVDGGAAKTANLRFPKGITADALGNLYVADSLNHRLRKVSLAGDIRTVAGIGVPGYSGDGGNAVSTQLNSPYGIALAAGDALVFSDLLNYRVRSVVGLPLALPVTPAILSVLNAAGGQPVITPGAYVSIYGTNLALRTDDWGASITDRKLPTQLSGVSVSVGATPAYVYYVSPGQVNIVVPDVSPGAVQIQVTNAGITSAPFNATAQRYSPAFFLWGQYAVATHTDYSLCVKAGTFGGVSTIPAKPGEWIVLWGSGFGPTDAPLGILTPPDKSYLTAPVTLTVGGVDAPVYLGAAVLASGFAGLYQIAAQIPTSTPDGDVRVRATVGGVQSPDNVFITVKR
jgi:uncharacterized protein (TIGR03437 family)